MKKQVAINYIEAINIADVEKLYDLMTPDYLFIDSLDKRVTGNDQMKQAWIGYFSMFPDYKIEVNKIVEEDSFICVFGYASGTYKNLKNKENSNYWRVPAAWTVLVENNKVKQWQVYADNIPAVEVIKRNSGKLCEPDGAE